jgi:hypothetical protein
MWRAVFPPAVIRIQRMKPDGRREAATFQKQPRIFRIYIQKSASNFLFCAGVYRVI